LVKFLFPWLRGRIGRFLLYRIVLPSADHVFVQTERMRENMVEKGFDRDDMTPVPMGVDMEEIGAADIRPAEDPRLVGKRVLVYLGTLDRPRQIERLFEMMSILRRSHPETVLVLVGDTEDEAYRLQLKEQAERAGVADAVIWTGWLPMQQGWRYVRAAEVGLSPIPRGELLDVGSPTKALEYMALGVPVLGNDNPDQAWVIQEGKAGRCVPYTAKDFAEAVIELLNLDAGKRAEMAMHGRRFVCEHRDYAVLAEMVAERYQQLMSN
jgi:glycosyltransferase involved in cell wall biosynthesis